MSAAVGHIVCACECMYHVPHAGGHTVPLVCVCLGVDSLMRCILPNRDPLIISAGATRSALRQTLHTCTHPPGRMPHPLSTLTMCLQAVAAWEEEQARRRRRIGAASVQSERQLRWEHCLMIISHVHCSTAIADADHDPTHELGIVLARIIASKS
jgi:hypothetical protein